ncbi:MAG: amylo-alpha-1,6-glucosidase [Bacteroidales bacterium]
MITLRNIFKYSILIILITSWTEGLAQSLKGQSIRTHRIALTKKKKPESDTTRKLLIGFLSLRSYQDAAPDIQHAFDQLKAIKEFSSEFMITREFEKQSKKSSRFAAIWIHRPDTSALDASETEAKLVESLKYYTKNGGRLLLTQQASHYINVLGFEPETVQDSTKSCIDDGNGRRLGFHAFREHPLFNGLNGGAYILRPSADLTTRIAGFFGDHVPQNGKVVAVDWDYIFLREDSKLILEYTPGKGKVISVGGYMNFSIPSTNGAHLARFTQNCFEYLLNCFAGLPEFYWDYAPAVVTACPSHPETDLTKTVIPQATNWIVRPTEIDLKRRFASENFWDVAGERMVTMGIEKGGIEEIWAHPFMALRDYEVGIRFSYKDTIFWLNDERPEINVSPACFSREYKFQRAYLKELVVNDPTEANGVVHYEYRGVYPAELIIRFRSNLRLMWPYSDRVTGSICHSWNSTFNALTIQDQAGFMTVMIGGTKEPLTHLSGQFEGFTNVSKDSAFQGIPTKKIQAAGLISYQLDMNDNLDVVISASVDGYDTTLSQFIKAISRPMQVYQNALAHSNNVFAKSLLITTPDRDFNIGYRWSLQATDRFFVNTPRLGKALVAGYATTRKGWDGGHKVNGRPGYAWYFGRDAEWSGFALLDCGDFEKVMEQLEFFNKFQDLNGKIFHEATTSGIFHYDAADATPLYVVLAGKYFRHTNDTAFLNRTWPNIKRAINFCFSTDTDHDHLIENTNVGHGWVEGGELYGSHSTIYMAGSWGAALTEASTMARFMNDIESESYMMEAGIQKKIIDLEFWDNSSRYFSYGKNRDGSFRKEQTILPTVPIYFRMADPQKASVALKNIAGNAFTTNWGARILREDSPWFRPTGYHYGSVWPLFTGWASLAEYSTGRAVQGFSHLMNNLNVYQNWGLGFVEEVLNGAEYKPSGVCAHQCWSETMVLQPSIEGMLGLEISAQEHKIHLAPQLPPQWDSIDIRHIRMADQTVDFHYSRVDGVYQYQFHLDQGGPVRMEFMPAFPAGTRFASVLLDGKAAPATTFKTGQSMILMLSFDLVSGSKLVVETESGISVLPVACNPKPGDPAEGMRILSCNFSGNRYQVELEGMSGSSGILEIWSGDADLRQAENARFLNQSGRICRFSVDFEKSEMKYITKTITLNTR